MHHRLALAGVACSGGVSGLTRLENKYGTIELSLRRSSIDELAICCEHSRTATLVVPACLSFLNATG
jgi:hypothetical protein